MVEHKLREHLEQVRRLINELAAASPESHERLNALIADIERLLADQGDGSRHPHLLGNLKETIRHFEVEHPTATAVLNDLMVTLGNMGI